MHEEPRRLGHVVRGSRSQDARMGDDCVPCLQRALVHSVLIGTTVRHAMEKIGLADYVAITDWLKLPGRATGTWDSRCVEKGTRGDMVSGRELRRRGLLPRTDPDHVELDIPADAIRRMETVVTASAQAVQQVSPELREQASLESACESGGTARRGVADRYGYSGALAVHQTGVG